MKKALEDAPDVQLSTREFTRYNITETDVLNCSERRWKIKCEM